MNPAVHQETYRWLSEEMRRHGLQNLKDLQHYSGIRANVILDLLFSNGQSHLTTVKQLKETFETKPQS